MGKTKHIDYDYIDDYQEISQKRLKNMAKLEREMRHKREIHDEPIQKFEPRKGSTRKMVT